MVEGRGWNGLDDVVESGVSVCFRERSGVGYVWDQTRSLWAGFDMAGVSKRVYAAPFLPHMGMSL